MGLFDLFKRKPAPATDRNGPSPEYVLAHDALRQFALSDPLKFLNLMASPDAERFIDALLRDVARQCGRQASFDASSVKIHPTHIGDLPCAVIEFPEPKETTEAFMVALVVAIDPSSDQPFDKDRIQARYYTLEKGHSQPNQQRTVLGGWDTTSRLNFGEGPEPTVEAFVAALEGDQGDEVA